MPIGTNLKKIIKHTDYFVFILIDLQDFININKFYSSQFKKVSTKKYIVMF